MPGYLIEFRIASASLYHRRGKVIHLLDAYVCSGYFAAQHLPEGQYNPDMSPLPRRYQDGLESDERDEDTLFMVWWYRGSGKPSDATTAVPPLSGKRRISVFRTRSKLERDAWVWVLNTEIERVSRMMSAREKVMRNQGTLVLE